jgi:hypothetical protein
MMSLTLVHRFITPHAANKNYKAFVKALLRVTTDPHSQPEVLKPKWLHVPWFVFDFPSIYWQTRS